MLPQALHVCTAQCTQCVSHIMSTSLRLKPCVLMRARVHQVLYAHVLGITRLAISISDMYEHKPCPITFLLHAIYRALNKSLVPRRMPLPSPLNTRLKYYLRQVPIYFQTISTCAVTTRLIPQRMLLPSPFHFTRTIKLSAHLNACSFPFQPSTWVSFLIPPNRSLYSATPLN